MIESPNPFEPVSLRDRIVAPPLNFLIRLLLSQRYRKRMQRYIDHGVCQEFYRGGRAYPTP